MSFVPYLFFSGNCAEAFAQYQQIFGGELSVMRNSDVPADSRMPGDTDFVMHASLQLGPDSFLLGSDDPSGDNGRKVGFSVSFSAPDLDIARTIHAALSAGGEVTMPVEKTFWSAGFGMCVDRFGVPWMIDVAHAPE